MWLTRLSITRPITILMLVLTLVILGFVSQNRLPVDLYPDIDIPIVLVSTVYAGTGPEEMETLVTKPIEDQLSTISGLDELTSTSSEGMSLIVVKFTMATDINDAAADVRSKLDAIRSALPDDVNAPVVIKADLNAMPVIRMNIASTRRSPLEIRRIADDIVKDRLSQVPGVASVSVAGGDIREIRVEVDKDRLAAYNLSISQIVSALQNEDLNLPSGTVEEQTKNYAVRVMGEFTDPQQILDVRIPISGNPNLRIRDIATVRDTVAEATTYNRVNGGSSVSLTIQKQSDANTVAAVDGVKAELEKLTGKPFTDAGLKAAKNGNFKLRTAAVLPADLSVTTSMDQSTFIKDSLHDVYESLILGALLAVLIVFLFLHSIRGTVIVALAIPTSIIATFLVMNMLGFSINMMSMLGLSLAVGILVDDSIVVLENIHRHLRMGESPKEAALNGRTEIGLAAMTITLVDVVVFVPIAFMGGIVGQMFRQFGITIAAATLFSLFISFTLTPMLASRWLKTHEQEEEEEELEKVHPGLFKRFTDAWERGYGRVDAFYRRVLAWSLDHHAAVICLGVMTFIASIGTTLPKPDPSNPKAGMPMFVVILLMGIFALIGSLCGRRAKKLSPIISHYEKDDDIKLPAPAGKPLFIAFVVMTLFCLFVPTQFRFEFSPQVDQRQFSIKIEEPVGTPLDVTDAETQKIEDALRKFPETKTLSTTVGGSGGFMSISASDTANINVELKDMQRGYRTTTDVIKAINAQFAEEPGVKITASVSSGMGGGSNAPITIQVSGQDIGRTQEVANQISNIVARTDGTYGTELSWREGRPELQAHIDRDRAAQYGMSVAQIASALHTSMEGDTSTKFRQNGKEYDIRVALPKEQRNIIDQVPSMVVGTSPSGQPVYLYEVVRLEPAAGPTKIERSDRQRSVKVTAQIAQGAALGNIQQKINPEIAKLDTRGVTIKWTGQAEDMGDASGSMAAALLLAMALVFILMAALFESLISPFIIGFSVPQAMAGALIALSVTQKSLSIISMIGIIMLVGLVTKNAILVVDYTNTLRRERGMSRREALL
ncbi:MAG TPA: efflux RND transporter permease subunit, partial [Armatimonadota bacterium]|nr:efflux RND transporter permease subunit [Armatimonadota bacterium]